MRYARNIALFAAVGCVAALILALTGCKVPSLQATNCSNGQCVTTSVGPASSAHRHSHSPAPVQSSMGASPSVPGATAPVPDASAAVSTCLGGDVPDQDTLMSLTTYDSQGARNLATCLVIPPQEMDLFLHLLYKYAVHDQGQFGSDDGRQQFAGTVTTTAQRCHAGQS